MIVELYGLPAAGKTTFWRKTKTADVELIGSLTTREIVYYNFRFLLRHPHKWFILLWLSVRNSKNIAMFYLKVRNVFLLRNARVMKAMVKKYNISIIDEGHVQNLLSIPEDKLEMPDILQICKYIIIPDVVLIFDTNLSKRRERLASRNFVLRNEFGPRYIKSWQENLEHNNLVAIKAISSLTRTKMIVEGTDFEDALSWIKEHEATN
jgi:hypothetical protein